MKHVCMLIHGESGHGKSRLIDTAPGPRLVLDVEGGSDWTPSPKIQWDPAVPPPTDGLDRNTTVVVMVRDFRTIQLVTQWLTSGKHPFESVCIDSLTEAQKRCKDELAGTNQMSEQLWGQLLAKMEVLVRQWRDLKVHPSKPVHVFISALSAVKDNKYVADVQGALGRSLPGFVDVNGFLFSVDAGDGSGRTARYLQIQPTANISAKDRTDVLTVRFGNQILTSVGRDTSCDLTCIVCAINGIDPEGEAK